MNIVLGMVLCFLLRLPVGIKLRLSQVRSLRSALLFWFGVGHCLRIIVGCDLLMGALRLSMMTQHRWYCRIWAGLVLGSAASAEAIERKLKATQKPHA